MGLIVSAVFLITLFHYQTTPTAGIRHVIFRELYFLPIILAGFWFGLRGGLSTALIISILYGPLIFSGSEEFSAHDFGNAMEIVLFILIGGLLGGLKDRATKQQKRLRQVESLAAMGRATAMIAHDLKTPLITIAGLARRLTKNISSPTPESEKIMVIRQQAERLEKQVRDMLFFAKPMQLSLEQRDLYKLFEDAKAAVSEIAQRNRITIDVPVEEFCTCQLDSERMMLVLMNLLTNAIEASLPNDMVSVSCRHYDKGLCIDVSDRGTGIPAAIKERIFEPFVSGKEKGTGLGLPICKKIVEAHSGNLTCSNNPGGGTTFSILLP